MVKVLLHIPDLNEDPHPSEVYHLVQLKLMDVDPHKMERQVDAIDNKYLEIQYYDNPHWYSLTDTEKVHQMHKVRLGRFTNHDSWLEIDGKEYRYSDIYSHEMEMSAIISDAVARQLIEEITDD